MPSGKTHDAVTFLLAVPTFAIAWKSTGSVSIAAVVAAAFLFGGLMFGPDLDTHSVQYTRWSVFRFVWYPYQAFFAHRSRWSHGLVFGTLFRVVYFVGALTLLSFLALYIYAIFNGGALPDLASFIGNWRQIGEVARESVGADVLTTVFVGLWLGAASHTLTDMAGSFVKHGRIMEFL